MESMTEHEAVELGFGQFKGTALLDWVLRGDHQERRGQFEGRVADRHFAFLHRFEQSTLNLGSGPVDLVGQQ